MQSLLRVKELVRFVRLPQVAKAALRADRKGLQSDGRCSFQASIDFAMDWLYAAQDYSLSNDGGVAREFSLISGWATSYPETTGYIIPTLLDYAAKYNSDEALERSRRMLDWLVSIQFPEGGFQGGKIDSQPKVPVTFNTGQILIGLSKGATRFGDAYLEPTVRAGCWLRDTLDPDGCWRKFPTPFAAQGEKAYETHVAWGLFEADLVAPGNGFREAAMRNIDWALTKQRPNGWFESCCLDTPDAPLAHTLGYVLRGTLEAYRHTCVDKYLTASIMTAEALLQVQESDGRIAGRFDCQWMPVVSWACLTGIVQIAYCWFYLYEITGDANYLRAAKSANHYVRRTQATSGPRRIRGGIKGSYPVDGDYGAFQYPNWSAKFFIDSLMYQQQISEAENSK